MKRPSVRPRLTPRLMLRPFHRKDVNSVLEAVEPSIDDLARWLPWARPGYGRSDALAFIRDSAAAWQEGRAFDFAIRRIDDPEQHVGNVSVWFTSRAAAVGEIGYWVRTDETSNGLATEATARILEVAFDELEMHRVVLRIAVGNVASERIAEKLGFTREGLLREEVRIGDVWVDHSVWGLLDHEYRGARELYRTAGWV